MIPAILATLALHTPPPPIFARPEPIPAARLIKSLEHQLRAWAWYEKRAKLPPDIASHIATLHYKLARVHYMVLFNRSTILPGHESPRAPSLGRDVAGDFYENLLSEEASRRARRELRIDADTDMSKTKWNELESAKKRWRTKLEKTRWRPVKPGRTELKRRFELALRHFDTAIARMPAAHRGAVTLARCKLGRASLLEQMLDLGLVTTEAKVKPRYAEVRDLYYALFDRSRKADLASRAVPMQGASAFVSHEAGQGFLRIARRSEQLAKGQFKRIAIVAATTKALEAIPPGFSTPIVIGACARPTQTLAELVDPQTTVTFDLDGDGIAERRPWLRRTTKLLVWDPFDRRTITSGRQLFGSVTFFSFHDDGYAALALLDENGDGAVSGIELDGLAIWTDRNGDGRSTREEVVPAYRTGLVRILTRARRRRGVLANPSGAVYRDGRAAPTFDWLAGPSQ